MPPQGVRHTTPHAQSGGGVVCVLFDSIGGIEVAFF